MLLLQTGLELIGQLSSVLYWVKKLWTCIPCFCKKTPALNHGRLKASLLQRYNYTEQGHHQRFREAKLEGSENSDQFIVHLKNYFIHSLKLFDVKSSFDGVVYFMARE